MKVSMKQIIIALALSLFFSSCHRTTREVWEDTKTAGRYMNKGFTSLLGRHDDSRPRANTRGPLPPAHARNSSQGSMPSDFIPLADDERYTASSLSYPASRESPGDPNSPIPSVDGFSDPQGKLAELFRKIHFETDNYTVRGEENLAILQSISSYLTSHPTTYVFVGGHADERGPASYNLALGAKRSNAVRDYLIEQGVNPDQLFTISYGKERPLVLGHDEISWQENRRSDFKLYER